MTQATFVLLVRLATVAVGSDDVPDARPGRLPSGLSRSAVAWTKLEGGVPVVYYDPGWLADAKPEDVLYMACHEACHTAFDRRALALPSIEPKDRSRMEVRARECGVRWAATLRGR